MIVTEPVAASPQMLVPPAESDTLTALVQSVRPAPAGIPQSLWDAALVGPIAEFLSRPGKRFRGRLVELSWRLAGGRGNPPPELPVVVELLHAGSLIVDDIEDDSVQRRGRAALHRQVGLPLALNAGNWLYFWPLSLLGRMGFPCSIEREMHRRAVDAVRRCHEGQALDLAARLGELHPSDIPAVAHTISAWKTGSLMALAAELGAIAAKAEPAITDALALFGERLGVGLQMYNDLSELTGAAGPLKCTEDLLHGRVTWPWAWAAQRLPAALFDALQARGAKLAAGSGDAGALARDLRTALGPDPAQPIRAWLADAVADLSTAVLPGPALEEVRAEIARLEVSYA
ncbi:MAG: polyprenyl synthetase family protein [Gemmataceae bacterium]|nr:polyprenyl synthetase family protein [Gemmata sp.]MDW8199035.1 polyprenyl synthetase family protein [Gemmataceae bacterium]